MEKARSAYYRLNAGDELNLHMPIDYTRFTTTTQNSVLNWMRQHLPIELEP